MGGITSTLWPLFDRLLMGTRNYRILMLGLDSAGKTTILYRLKLGEVQKTVPTIGFNVERVEYRNISFTVWDVGGQDRLRMLWRHYFEMNDALIFVVDSADHERAALARAELERLIHAEELKDSAVLVLANKQDLPGAMDIRTLAEKLDLKNLIRNPWYIQACVGTDGTGLYEGIDWLSNVLNQR